jgi:hypothetical protein
MYWIEFRRSVRDSWQVFDEREYDTEAEAREAIKLVPREHYVRLYRNRRGGVVEQLTIDPTNPRRVKRPTFWDIIMRDD